MTKSEVVKVFIASPGDLAEERALFPGVLKFFEGLTIGGREYCFHPLGYEYALPGAGRPQEIINKEQLMQCDIFVMLLWKRWGVPTGKFSSGTEEEFKLGLKRYKDTKRPRMLVYFRSVPPNALAAPDKQLDKVLRFKRRIERERLCLYQRYDDPPQWRDMLIRHLIQWISGSLDEERIDGAEQQPSNDPAVSLRELLQLQKEIAKKQARLETAENKLRAVAVEHAVEAVKLVGKGKFSRAEEKFAKSLEVFEEPEVLNNYGLFLFQLGSLTRAKEIFEKLLRLTMKDKASRTRASAYGNLGIICSTKGNLSGAKLMFERALKTSTALGFKEGEANAYLNLGNISLSRGALGKAEEMFEKSLELYLAAGHKEGMATAHGSLGNVCLSRGDFKKAEAMYMKDLIISGGSGREPAIANTYGNLGNVYLSQGILGRAKQAYQRALKIDELIGRKEGIADGRLNLGVLHAMRGDLGKAREMQEEALALYMALGRIEGMANAYINLGNLYERQGELNDAKDSWRRAMKFYTELGSHEQARQVKSWIAAIELRRGAEGGSGLKTS